jgi:glycosyltransferase involved in cell wall biosynthesis
LNSTRRLSNLLVIAPEKSASLELVAGYPFRELEQRGTLKLRIRTAEETSADDLTWCDVLFAIRAANAAMAALVGEAKRIERLVICHWDDDLLSIPRASSSYAYFARPGVRNLTLTTLLQADVVLSSSEILIKHLHTILARNGKAQTPTMVLPVPALNINPFPYHSTARPHGAAPFTIGYAGSADQAKALQALVVPALEFLWGEGEEIHLQLIGPRLAISSQWQKFVSYLTATTDYPSWLALRNDLKWDAALAPLLNGHFYRCKFYNKYIEFAAAGIPCLFSDVEPFNAVVKHQENGLLVKNSVEHWVMALRVVRDAETRTRIALAAKKDVAKQNNIATVSTEIELLLRSCLNYRAPAKKANPHIEIKKKIQWITTNVTRRFF